MQEKQTVVVNYPPVLGVEQLAELLGKSVPTIFADRCRRPGVLPPACVPPGHKNPRWLLADVIEWLSRHREILPPSPDADVLANQKKRGRPTKSEIVARRRAGDEK
jgi:predicted DNA-binding transcriptional regulator AlpA